MKTELFKSEIVGLHRILGKTLPEIVEKSMRDDFKQERIQNMLRVNLLTIKSYIESILDD